MASKCIERWFVIDFMFEFRNRPKTLAGETFHFKDLLLTNFCSL